MGNKSKKELIKEYKVSRRTLINWFETFWNKPINPDIKNITGKILIIDGKFISRNIVCLIGIVDKKVVNWKFLNGENYLNWKFFLLTLDVPFAIVCDGQRGMLKAIKQLFPRVIIQRCQFHVIKYCLAKLTRNPESIAGQILRLLVLDISKVKTKDDLDNWINDFKDWYFNYENFLNEKTYSKTSFTKTNHPRWHYSHKNLHACFSHLKNALPYLFQYINHPTIPNTTNQIEGGINSLLQEKLRNHRGLKLKKRIILTSYFLSSKQ